MKKTVINEITIVCEPPNVPFYIRNKGQEAIVEYYESWVKEFEEFMRDHRSQDPISLSVERHTIDVCSFCGLEWDVDDVGFPFCCKEAQEEYKTQNNQTILVNVSIPLPTTPTD